MTSEREALDRIAALCDRRRGSSLSAAFLAEDVRAVLAEVSPGEPGGVLDRDQAREVLREFIPTDEVAQDYWLGRLESAVRPTAIPRDALWVIYDRYSLPNDVQEERGLGFDAFVQEVEAAVRPAAIDRDALRKTLQHYDARFRLDAAPGEVLDALVALVRPVAGATRTPDAAKLAAVRAAVLEARRRAPHSFEYLIGEVQAILDDTVHGQGSA